MVIVIIVPFKFIYNPNTFTIMDTWNNIINMNRIRDTVRDKYIEVGDDMMELLETPEFQSLRYVSQLGVVSLVYPSANHTRFEHSLGVFDTVKRFIDSLDITDENLQRQLKIAGLLHDVGHGGYSHNIEGVDGAPNHEESTKKIIQDFNERGLIRDMDVIPVIEFVAGEREPNIIAGEIDADRIDYLTRDAYYTGINHGIDADTIIQNAHILDEQIIYDVTAVEAIENLLVARKNMYRSVYYHPKILCAEQMLITAINNSSINPQSLHQYNDRTLHTRLLNDDNSVTVELYKRLVNRNLYKEYRACSSGEHDSIIKQLLNSELEEHEWVVSEQKELFSDIDIMINNNDEIVKFTELSPVTQELLTTNYLSDNRIFTAPNKK